MDAKELRPGNHINMGGEIIPIGVSAIQDFYFTQSIESRGRIVHPSKRLILEPAFINDDVLTDLGFKYESETWQLTETHIGLKKCNISGFYRAFDLIGNRYISSLTFKHVHQIENLYFSLEEITLKFK